MLSLLGHTGQVMSLRFSPDGRWLASAGWDGSVRIWDVRAGAEVRCIRTSSPRATRVAFTPDSEMIIAGFGGRGGFLSGDANLIIFPREPAELDTAEYVHPSRGWGVPQGKGIRNIVVFPDGKTIGALCMTFSKDPFITFWKLPERELIHRLRTDKIVEQIALRPDGAELAALSHRPARIILWTLNPLPQDAPSDEVLIGDEFGESLAYSPDGETIVAALGNGKMFWWPPDGPDAGMLRPGHGSSARALTFSPDGRTVLTGGSDGLIHLWDPATQKRRLTFDWQIGEIGCADFAPDGLTAAAGGNGPIVIWDVDV